MTTADLTPHERLQSRCMTYFKLRSGRLDWSGQQVDAFLADFEETCAAAGTTVRDALTNAACALDDAGRDDFLKRPH